MSYTFTRINMRRLNVVGKNTLQSIGDLKILYDYRKAIAVDGSNNVLTLGDLGNGGLNLSQPGPGRRPVLYSDGIGSNGVGQTYLLGSPDAKLKFLHDGTANVLFWVQQYDNPTNVDQRPAPILTTQAGSGAGVIVQTLGASNQLVSAFFNNAGTSLGNIQAGANSVPEDSTFRLMMQIYYGTAGAPANNHKFVIANSTVTSTRNPAFGTDNPNKYFAFQFGLVLNSKIKCMGAYNLSGKSFAQIDAFIQLFIATLKQDSEYSALVTI